MHFIHAVINERRSWQQRLTMIAGVCCVVLLVGSLALSLVHLRQGSGANPLGHAPSKAGASAMTLQVSPASIAIGGMITLRGSHFTPNAEVGLTHDGSPLIDTAGQSVRSTDASGSFHDAVVIDNSWTAGPHLIRAEDAHLHKSASFAIQVTGQGHSQLPPHLLISSKSVDLGSGDQATNATQVLTIWNGGGGQISWQATSTQPWLLLSTGSGTISGAQQMHIMLGADRSNLRAGTYQAKVIFTSNAGRITLPVQMKVTP